MVTEKECVDEKLQSENGAEIQGEKKWWRERYSKKGREYAKNVCN